MHQKEKEGENVNPLEEKMTKEESKASSSTQEEEENKLDIPLVNLIRIKIFVTNSKKTTCKILKFK